MFRMVCTLQTVKEDADQRPMETEQVTRPTKDTYYMNIAETARTRADCKGRKVGAVIVVEDRIVATGYNGVPSGMLNCTDGGCVRCQPGRRNQSEGYDVCICVHAEGNAIASAARNGIAVGGGTVYTTLSPCFSCAKELYQAGINEVVYKEGWEPRDDEELRRQYRILLASFPNQTRRL